MSLLKCHTCGSVEIIRNTCDHCGGERRLEGFKTKSPYFYYYKVLLERVGENSGKRNIIKNIRRSKSITEKERSILLENN
jgi:hypothetical protein